MTEKGEHAKLGNTLYYSETKKKTCMTGIILSFSILVRSEHELVWSGGGACGVGV